LDKKALEKQGSASMQEINIRLIYLNAGKASIQKASFLISTAATQVVQQERL
jgi:hypothetical protein